MTIEPRVRTVYVDPAYKAYYEDRLFDENDLALNRDDTLTPFIRMRAALAQHGIGVHTADYLLSKNEYDQEVDYYSFGVLENYRALAMQGNVRMRAFVIFEPPVVAPQLYQELPRLTATFERVYVHNVEGDGYSLHGVDRSRLRQLFWPQPHADVIDAVWQRQDRQRRIVVINGNHKPVSSISELYSKRIEAMAELARLGAVDLYGRGWERWWSRASLWLPYWRNRKMLMSIYKGSCASKYAVMSNYTFALCFENMAMKGYVTEKLFDCLYAGTIPLYLGAPDIHDLIPKGVYIDCRKFASWQSMFYEIERISPSEIQRMREEGRSFLRSSLGAKYYNSLTDIISEET